MANFFSADYWKALYFKAMGGQETAVDPNAMRGTFAGSSSWTGTLALPEGFIAGSFAGASEFVGTLTSVGEAERPGTGYRGRRPTLGELRDAFFDRLLRRGKRRKRDAEDPKPEIVVRLDPADLPPAVTRSPEQIEEFAAEIAARVEERANLRALDARVDGTAFGRGGPLAGLPSDNVADSPEDTVQAEIEAALEQAITLSLMAEARRKQDEEDLILILLLAA